MIIQSLGKPSRKEREVLQRRREILDVAERLFALKGFFKTSMADIARESEFAVGSLYQFFRSKDAIYAALMEEKFEEYLSLVARELDLAEGVIGKMEALISAKLQFFEKHRGFFRIYVSEWGGPEWTMKSALGGKIWKQYETYLSLIIRLMQSGIRKGIFKKMDPREMAYLFNGMMNSVIRHWIMNEGKESLVGKAASIKEVFLAGVLRGKGHGQPAAMGRGRRVGLCVAGGLVLMTASFVPLGWTAELSLEDVYRMALENNEKIGIAQEALRQAGFSKDKARSFLLPKVTVEGRYERHPEAQFGSTRTQILRPEQSSELQFKAEQPLYSGGRDLAGLAIARETINVSREDLLLAKEDLLFQVADAYYQVLKAERAVEINEKEITRLEEHRRGAAVRLAVGEETKTVVLRAEAELARARAELIGARNDLRIAQDRLSLLARIPGEFRLKEPPMPEVPSGSEEEMERLAHESRPEMKKSRLNETISLQGLHFARGGFLPTLSIEASYFLRDQSPQSFFFLNDESLAVARLTLPFFEGGLRMAEWREARSRLHQAALEKSLLEEEIGREVKRAAGDLAAITSTLEHLKAQRTFAAENFDMVEKQFRAGLSTNLDALDANALLLDAEKRLTEATYDRAVAILRLQKVTGVFLKHADVEGVSLR